MTPIKPKYAAHGEPGTEAWIEIYADASVEAERLHKIYAHGPETLAALQKLWAFLEDLRKSNPGYLGKLCLQDCAQMNEAFMQTESVLSKFPAIK